MDYLQRFALALIITYQKLFSRDNYVYAYLDPRKPGKFIYKNYCFDYEPFYIGRGKRYRMNSHMSPGQMNRETNLKKKNKIEKIFSKNLKPIIIIINKNINRIESEEEEINLINLIGRDDLGKGPLTNLTDGGDGCSCVVQSEETRLKKSLKLKGKKRVGFKFSEEELLKKSIMMKERMKTYKISEITKNKIRETLNGKPTSRSKTFMMISPSGETKITNCLSAFARENDLGLGLLYEVARGRQTHHKNWKCYEMDISGNPILPRKKENRPREVTEKMRNAWKKNGEMRKGKPLSEETKKKLKTTKKTYTEDSRKRMTEACLKKYLVTSPDGIEYRPYSLKEFCKCHNLEYTRMIGISTKRISVYKGWKCEKIIDS